MDRFKELIEEMEEIIFYIKCHRFTTYETLLTCEIQDMRKRKKN